MQLTAGTDRKGSHYMLDTTDGTISRYCAGGGFEYPPTYALDDPRGWRDRECDPETVTLREWLEEWRGRYREMTTLAVPPPNSFGGDSTDPLFGDLQAEPGSYHFEEMKVGQHFRLPPPLFDAKRKLGWMLRYHIYRGYEKSMASMYGPTRKHIRKRPVSMRSGSGGGIL